MPINGLVVMTPTSIASTGTGNSSSIGANGEVTFSSCATLSLNGVFTSSYDNYMIVMRHSNTDDWAVRFRLRASGTDNSTTSSYVSQYWFAASTSVSAERTTVNYGTWGARGNTQRAGFTAYLFGPNLAQPTAWRSVMADDYQSAAVTDFAGTHNQSTSYDGVNLIASGGSFTGAVTVYGFNQ